MPNPRLGLTGGIASGKTTFGRLFCQHWCAVSALPLCFFDADACARDLIQSDLALRDRIARTFFLPFSEQEQSLGLNPVLKKTSSVNGEGDLANLEPFRAQLRHLIFTDPKKKQQLESLLHPLIRQRWQEAAQRADTRGEVFLGDVPLLYETQAEQFFDSIVVVACSPKEQMRRMVQNRGLEVDLAKKILASQELLTVKMQHANHVVWNEGPLGLLEEQAHALIRIWNERFGAVH